MLPPSRSLQVTTFRQVDALLLTGSACCLAGLLNKPMADSPAEVRREMHEAESSSDQVADTVLAEPDAALVEAALLAVLAAQ